MGIDDSHGGGSERIWKAMARMLSRANAAGVVIYTLDARGLQTGSLTAEDNPITRDWGPAGGSGGGGASGPPSGAASGSSGTGGGGTGGSGQSAGASPPPPAVGSGAGFLSTASGAITSAGRGRLGAILDAQDSLKFIADQTGGLAIENTNDLNLGISRILDDQQGYYLLGYLAPKDAPRGGWDQDRVKVRVKRPGLRVRARQGFFGPFDTSEPKPTPADPLVTSALSPFGSGGIAVRLTSLFGHDAKTGPYVRSLLFTSYRTGNPSLFSIDAGGGAPRLISSQRGLNLGGRWSPAGRAIAVALENNGQTDIALLDPSGQLIRWVTKDRALDVSPSWSPDGQSIVFCSDRGGGPQIYVVSAQGGTPRRVTFEGN